MPKSEKDRDALRQALNYDWPEIQKHLIAKGKEKDGDKSISLDSWWLDKFDREGRHHATARSRNHEHEALACRGCRLYVPRSI